MEELKLLIFTMHSMLFFLSLALWLLTFRPHLPFRAGVTKSRGTRLTSEDFPSLLCRCSRWLLFGALSDVVNRSTWSIELKSQYCVSQVTTALCADFDEFAIGKVLVVKTFYWCDLLEHAINHLISGRVEAELRERIALLYMLAEHSIDKRLVSLRRIAKCENNQRVLSSLTFPRIFVD